MKFKAILLDVDGVLVDSENVFNECWRKAAKDNNYAMSYEQALELRSLDSQLARELFFKWYGNEKAYPAIRAARKTIMADYVEQKPLGAKPRVREFLEEVKGLPIKVAIVTSSPESRVSSYLASVGIDVNLFDNVITTEQVKRGKPFPDVYEYACSAIGFAPKECVAVEDSPNGVQAAHSAGCYTVMVPDLSLCTKEVKGNVDLELKTVYDLISIIQ